MNHRTERHTAPSARTGEINSDARILIVDDDDCMGALYEIVLNLEGFRTQTASDGEEALAMLAVADFDLVVTDCKMPRLDGWGLIRALRAAGNRIPVMMVSSSLAAGGALPADLRDEVAVALPKPSKTSKLLAGVARALRSRPVSPVGPRLAAELSPGALTVA